MGQCLSLKCANGPNCCLLSNWTTGMSVSIDFDKAVSSPKAWSDCFSCLAQLYQQPKSCFMCMCMIIMMTRTTLLPRTLCVSLLSKHSCSFIAPTTLVHQLQEVTVQHLPPCAFSDLTNPYLHFSGRKLNYRWEEIDVCTTAEQEQGL